MPIVIDRYTGETICKPEITREMKDIAWEIIIKNYVHRHPDIFAEAPQVNDSKESEI